MYAKTRRLPPHLTHANTSTANAFRSNPAWFTRGVRSFLGVARPGYVAYRNTLKVLALRAQALGAEVPSASVRASARPRPAEPSSSSLGL